MYNREILATLGTQDTGRRQTRQKKHNTDKAINMSNTDPTKIPGVKSGSCEGYAVPVPLIRHLLYVTHIIKTCLTPLWWSHLHG